MIIAPAPGNFVRLEVAKTGLMKGKVHVFEFPSYKGEATRNPDRYSIALDAASIECKDTWLKPDDLTKVMAYAVKDMLAAKRFPQILYRSTDGMLTIRDQSRPVAVSYKETSAGVFEGNSMVDMRLFGLKPPSAALGAVGTDPWMKLSFRLRVA